MDNGDVKYRVARLRYPLEDKDKANGVEFKADEMGISNKTGRKQSTNEWEFKKYLFPRPGLTLKRPRGTAKSERYTHGGLSMAECLIPLHKLEPKVAIGVSSQVKAASDSRVKSGH